MPTLAAQLSKVLQFSRDSDYQVEEEVASEMSGGLDFHGMCFSRVQTAAPMQVPECETQAKKIISPANPKEI